MNCLHCHHKFEGNFCPNCGHPIQQKRIDGSYVLSQLRDILFLESGFFYTVKELLIHPGKSIKDFLRYDRKRLVKPFVFIILTSLVYSLILYLFPFRDRYISYSDEGTSSLSTVFDWLTQHYGYANILMGVFMAIWTKVFFRKKGYNFFEILILLCFVIGMFMLILGIFGLISNLTEPRIIDYAGNVALIYAIWAIGNFFGGKWKTYLKAVAVYFLGLLSFALTAILMSILIDKLFQ